MLSSKPQRSPQVSGCPPDSGVHQASKWKQRGRRSLGGTTVPRRLRALLRRLAPPSIANEWGMCGALPPPAMHMMVAMHTTLLMATLVMLVEAPYLLLPCTSAPSESDGCHAHHLAHGHPGDPGGDGCHVQSHESAMHMVLFAMHTVMIGVDDVHFL